MAIIFSGALYLIYMLQVLNDQSMMIENNYYFHLFKMDRYYNFYYWEIFIFSSNFIISVIICWYLTSIYFNGFTLYYLSQKYLNPNRYPPYQASALRVIDSDISLPKTVYYRRS